jgi:hypothetical protein
MLMAELTVLRPFPAVRIDVQSLPSAARTDVHGPNVRRRAGSQRDRECPPPGLLQITQLFVSDH